MRHDAEREVMAPSTRSAGYRCSIPGLAGFAGVPSPGTALYLSQNAPEIQPTTGARPQQRPQRRPDQRARRVRSGQSPPRAGATNGNRGRPPRARSRSAPSPRPAPRAAPAPRRQLRAERRGRDEAPAQLCVAGGRGRDALEGRLRGAARAARANPDGVLGLRRQAVNRDVGLAVRARRPVWSPPASTPRRSTDRRRRRRRAAARRAARNRSPRGRLRWPDERARWRPSPRRRRGDEGHGRRRRHPRARERGTALDREVDAAADRSVRQSRPAGRRRCPGRRRSSPSGACTSPLAPVQSP